MFFGRVSRAAPSTLLDFHNTCRTIEMVMLAIAAVVAAVLLFVKMAWDSMWKVPALANDVRRRRDGFGGKACQGVADWPFVLRSSGVTSLR